MQSCPNYNYHFFYSLEYSKRYNIPYCSCNIGVLTYRRDACGCWCDCIAAPIWGYGGYHCTKRVPPNRCVGFSVGGKCNNGRCSRINGGKGFKCICNEGYSGNRCTEKLM